MVKSCILLHGPPGCGKTRLAEAIANEAGVALYKINARDLISRGRQVYESEREIRELFQQACYYEPSVVFIDELEAIAYNYPEDDMKKRIVRQLVYSIKDYDPRPGYVLGLGATNCVYSMDPELKARFQVDDLIALGFPDEAVRIEILSVQTRNIRLEDAIDLKKIARWTPGYVGRDLTAIAHMAGHLAKKRFASKKRDELSKEEKDEDHSEDRWKLPWSNEELENLFVTMVDFEDAAKMVQPSSRFSDIPNVKFDDVCGLHSLKKEFDSHILTHIKFHEAWVALGMDLATGFLLYGPPGCGKTLIAKAVANEAGANFIHIKCLGLELETKWELRKIFSRAKAGCPCIILFEQVDALTTKCGWEWPSLTQLVEELDVSKHRNIHVICTTDRPEVMDSDMLRRGGLWKPVYVPLPSPDERGMILKALARNRLVDATVDLMMDEAAMAALRDQPPSMDTSSSIQGTIKETHFMSALEKIWPSVSDEDVKRF
ncbi:hypothetical protein SASPL_100318 [Salvia splendens]|uniref:AAA+ ATPase domain-containing protein n=1 Tax=Salvia splendens TaxID=180675 RepID=A0A8X8YPT1_SALSN|nr:hypothetical protein SASPL_100318 [Salvia splendens]